MGAGYDAEGDLGPGRYQSLATQAIGARSLLATLTWQWSEKAEVLFANGGSRTISYAPTGDGRYSLPRSISNSRD